MKKIAILSCVAILVSCSNKVLIQKAEKNDLISGKLFYALPANTLDFEIKIKGEVYERSQFFKTNASACTDYIKAAEDSLGLNKGALNALISNPSFSKFTIVDDEIIWTEGAVPDDSKVFIFRNEPKFYKDNTLTVAFNNDWLVSSGSISSENKTYELVNTFISTSLSVAASIAKSGVKPEKGKALHELCGGKFARLVKLKSDYEKFQLNPPANLNAEALSMSRAARLMQIEKEIESLFYTKKELTKTLRFSVYLSDKFKNAKGLALFKLDPGLGVLNFNSAVYPDILWPVNDNKQIVSTQITPAQSASYYSITTEPDTKSVLNIFTDTSLPKLNVGQYYGIAYNIPMNVRFYLKDGSDKLVKTSRFPVAQFGYVNTLDQKLNKADFTLDSLTGRLVKVTLESKAWLTTDRIKSGGALLPQADSTIKKKPKPTALETMQEEVKEKELRVKLKELDAKLQ
jgi:hypothetical protein